VALVQTSAASEPREVKVLVEYAQTLAGKDVIKEPIEVEAVLSVVFKVPTCVLVLALITEASDEEAVVTVPLNVEI
jgi:hypothetical protein